MTDLLKPCAVCGEVTQSSRCPTHRLPRKPPTRTDTSEWPWIKLSQRARACQPWCLLCGWTTNLQADHSPRAWARKHAGLTIRLVDVAVLCGKCNNRIGSSKPGSDRYAIWEATGADLTAETPDPSLPLPRGVGPRQTPLTRAAGSKFANENRLHEGRGL